MKRRTKKTSEDNNVRQSFDKGEQNQESDRTIEMQVDESNPVLSADVEHFTE
jgi:hypothetical protein